MNESLSPPAAIPDLSALGARSEWFAINRYFCRGGSDDRAAYILEANIIRLADAAVQDYRIAGQYIAQHHQRDPSTFGLAPLALATTHFESCVWHLERFIKHAKALRSCRTAEPELKALVPRESIFLRGEVEGRFTELRHTLAHLETPAQLSNILSGSSLALSPVAEGLIVANHKLSWGDLSSLLVAAHQCACRLAEFRPEAHVA